MIALENIRDLFRHMEWADALIWQRILSSDAARSDFEIRGLTQHLHTAQRSFLAAWHAESISIGDAGMQLEEIMPWGMEYHAFAAQYLQKLKPAMLDSEMVVPWSKGAEQRLGCSAQVTTLQETMLQVLMHTAHHRGQVSSRLRQLGVDPPLTDYIVWLWSGRPAAAWPALRL